MYQYQSGGALTCNQQGAVVRFAQRSSSTGLSRFTDWMEEDDCAEDEASSVVYIILTVIISFLDGSHRCVIMLVEFSCSLSLRAFIRNVNMKRAVMKLQNDVNTVWSTQVRAVTVMVAVFPRPRNRAAELCGVIMTLCAT